MRLVWAWCVLATMLACGSQFPKYSDNGTGGSGPDTGDVTAGSCSIQQPSTAQKNLGYDSFDLNKMGILDAGKNSSSLCKFMEDNNLNVAIFQFAGVFCSSCQDESIYFGEELSSDIASGKIGHVVVLTDFLEDYPESSFVKYMNDYAPSGLRAHDPRIDLWKLLSADPTAPVRPTALAVNRNGIGYLINTEGAEVEPLVEAARYLAGESDDSNPEPTDPTDPEPTDPTDPEPTDPTLPALELTNAQNFSVRDANGNTKRLADLFVSEYMIIDLAQYYCGPCRSLADKHQNSTTFQNLMSGTKCRTATIIPNNDMPEWIGRYPASSFVGKSSFGISSLFTVSNAFSLEFSGTPTVFMIDRKGKVIARRAGATPSEVNTLCQE